ncbi:MAG TPA: hypothetical protein VNK46_09280 [Nitrospiraceae bacterium]|jgi:hypothetical protein|nr:hypothetical protein [Nitrospiraceae bacterium]
MPIDNNFQHDEMSRRNPGDRVGFRELTAGAPPDSPAWLDAMAALGVKLSQAGVRVVVFFHGTFLGSDLFGVQRLDEAGGLKRGYSRGISGVDALLALMREGDNGLPSSRTGLKPPFANDEPTKKLLDERAGDAGNFTGAYVDVFSKAVNKAVSKPIVCVRELWSSEHHHLGRALAACRLLDRLRALCREHQLRDGDRILIQAHGHAGQVLAFASNLLTPAPIVGRKRVFEILRKYAEQTTHVELSAMLDRLERAHATEILTGVALDVVTFGTPVRYGWDPSGLGNLLHVVNHRVLRTDGKTWLAKMELPQITMEMPVAWGGDYVQQLAVAASDAVPTTEEAKAANKALWELVEPYDGFERWLECVRRAVRCPTDGLCRLVDYKDCTGSTNPLDHLFGHAAYTRMNAMLFNTSEIVRTLYAPGSG